MERTDELSSGWARWRHRGFSAKSKRAAITVFVLSVVIMSLAPVKTQASPLVNSLPWLHVQGNRIVDEKGLPVILRGVAIEEQCYMHLANDQYALDLHLFDEADVIELVQNWHASVIRVPIFPDLWENYPRYLEQFLDPIVDLGNRYGMYILLGWHAHGNPITGQADLLSFSNSPPFHGNPYNPNMTLATSFWDAVAERYKNDPWVIYSIFCEPTNILWKDWRPVAESLIDTVRSHNPRALVLVSGVDYAYDLSGVQNDPIDRRDVVYETHPYPGVTEFYGPWDQHFGFLSDRYPIFAGEWGYESSSSDRTVNATTADFGMPLVNYMKEKGMSWTAWILSPRWGPRILTDWSYDLTEFGELVRDTLMTTQIVVKTKTILGSDLSGVIVSVDGNPYLTPSSVTCKITSRLSARVIPQVNGSFYHFIGWQDEAGNVLSNNVSFTLDAYSMGRTIYAVFAP